tara:strand:+ start:309 stop:785 length:477 start_codon:yes stop_codon:yes gene_type:complete
MSYSSKYYSLDNEVIKNHKKTKNVNFIIPEPKKDNNENNLKPANYNNKFCSLGNKYNFGQLNSCEEYSTIQYKPSDFINKISNNNFISHIYERNAKNIDGRIPYVDLHHNIQTKKGKFLLRNNMLNKIDDIAHFDENLLEDLYCKYQNKTKMELLDSI